VRVIGGTCRGRRLRAPAGRATRPTSDKVRGAVFDMIGALGDFDLEGAAVLDLCAGSGALGIEALSRGGASAVFVESAPAALAVIRANVEALGFADRAEVVRADALAFLARRRHFDLALVDPPYAFDGWPALLERLDSTVAVLESGQELEMPLSWGIVRHKRYGDTLVTVVRHAAAPPDAPGQGQKGSP
jgi:16S rRNA (guanine966-N2)-methyltransferase